MSEFLKPHSFFHENKKEVGQDLKENKIKDDVDENLEINTQTLLMVINEKLTHKEFRELISENDCSLTNEIIIELVKVEKEEFIIGYFDKLENFQEIKKIIFKDSFIKKIQHSHLQSKFVEEIFSHSEQLAIELNFEFA